MNFNVDEVFGPPGSLLRECSEIAWAGFECTQENLRAFGPPLKPEAMTKYRDYMVLETLVEPTSMPYSYDEGRVYEDSDQYDYETNKRTAIRWGGRWLARMVEARLALDVSDLCETHFYNEKLFYHLRDVVYFLWNEGDMGGVTVAAYRVTPTPEVLTESAPRLQLAKAA